MRLTGIKEAKALENNHESEVYVSISLCGEGAADQYGDHLHRPALQRAIVLLRVRVVHVPVHEEGSAAVRPPRANLPDTQGKGVVHSKNTGGNMEKDGGSTEKNNGARGKYGGHIQDTW